MIECLHKKQLYYEYNTLTFKLLQNKIRIVGYEEKTELAKKAIMDIVGELESHVSVDVHIDSRLHSRFIGFKGSTLRQIMKTFTVSLLNFLQTVACFI